MEKCMNEKCISWRKDSNYCIIGNNCIYYSNIKDCENLRLKEVKMKYEKIEKALTFENLVNLADDDCKKIGLADFIKWCVEKEMMYNRKSVLGIADKGSNFSDYLKENPDLVELLIKEGYVKIVERKLPIYIQHKKHKENIWMLVMNSENEYQWLNFRTNKLSSASSSIESACMDLDRYNFFNEYPKGD